MSVTILPGRISLLENLFGLDANESNHRTLNSILEIDDDSSIERFKNREIRYFCIGIGGSTTNNLAFNVGNYETALYNMCPIRMVPENNDLSDVERANYRLRKRINYNGKDYIAYYAKALSIDETDALKIKQGNLDGANYNINPDHTIANPPGSEANHELATSPVIVGTTYSADVSAEDFKEYWKLYHNGSLVGANISEFGFIYAKDKEFTDDSGRTYHELQGAELFSKITSAPRFLDVENSSTSFTYTIVM